MDITVSKSTPIQQFRNPLITTFLSWRWPPVHGLPSVRAWDALWRAVPHLACSPHARKAVGLWRNGRPVERWGVTGPLKLSRHIPQLEPYRHLTRSVMNVSEPGVVLYAAGLKLFTEHAHLLASKHFPNQRINLNEEMGSLPSGINSSPLQGLCLEVSRCWGGKDWQWWRSWLPRCTRPWPCSQTGQAFLLAFPLSVEFWRCLPELPALIKPPFLRDIVYVCWSHRGICGHYFYFPKVNSGPESEMPLVSFHRKVPRTSSGPFWIYIWSRDKVGGKKLEGMSGHEDRNTSGSLRHQSTGLQSLCRDQGTYFYEEDLSSYIHHPTKVQGIFIQPKGMMALSLGTGHFPTRCKGYWWLLAYMAPKYQFNQIMWIIHPSLLQEALFCFKMEFIISPENKSNI